MAIMEDVLGGLLGRLIEKEKWRGSNRGEVRHVDGFERARRFGVSNYYRMLLDIDDEQRKVDEGKISESPTRGLWIELYDPKRELEMGAIEEARDDADNFLSRIRAEKRVMDIRAEFAKRRAQMDLAADTYQWATGRDRAIQFNRDRWSTYLKYALAAAGVVLFTSDRVRNFVYDTGRNILIGLGVNSNLIPEYKSADELRQRIEEFEQAERGRQITEQRDQAVRAAVEPLEERIRQYEEAERGRQEAEAREVAVQAAIDPLQERIRQYETKLEDLRQQMARFEREREGYETTITGLRGYIERLERAATFYEQQLMTMLRGLGVRLEKLYQEGNQTAEAGA